MQNYKLEREAKNTADWEKSTKEAKVRIGLYCHRRRRKKKEEEEEEGLVLVLLLCILKVPDSFPDSSAVDVIIVYRDFLSKLGTP
jgi:hypothetical protein